MSLLRVCAFVKCLNRRSVFGRCAVGGSMVDCCRLRVSGKNGAVRRISGTASQLQRRNVSFVIPKKDDAKKRVMEQSQLLDVLKARIQQLKSDVVLDLQHAKLPFLNAPSHGKATSSGQSHSSFPWENSDIPRSGKLFAKEAHNAHTPRWMKKLIKEKISKLRKKEKLIQKEKLKAKEKRAAKSKGKISTGTEATPQKMNLKTSKASQVAMTYEEKKEQASIDLQIAEKLSQKMGEWTSLGLEESRQQAADGTCADIQQSICAYLEACAFSGHQQLAYILLLTQHRTMTRRKQLNTTAYNIIMRIMAKKGSLNSISRIFILMEEAGMKPNYGSYAAALECMGRKEHCPPNVITRCLNAMQEDGLSTDELFSQGVFRQDERDMILNAIRVIQPEYQPILKANTNQVYSSLVSDFYMQREDHRYPKLDLTQQELQQRFKDQLNLEQACTITIQSVESSKPITRNMARMRKLLAGRRAEWHSVLLEAFKESKLTLAAASKTVRTRDQKPNIYPYLCLLEDSEYVDIMIQCVSNLPLSGESLKILAKDLGNRVYTNYCVRQKRQNHTLEKLGTIYNAYTQLLAKDTEEFDVLPREHWLQLELIHSSGPTLHFFQTSWPYVVTLELGTFMVDMMVKCLKINSDILNPAYERRPIPVFYHMYTFRSTRQIGFIKPHPILNQMLQEAMETDLTFDSYVMPMLCPPVPWTSVRFGAYLLNPTKLMRTVDGASQHEQLLEKCPNIQAVLDSLNQLGNCAWTINKPLLDIIISIFNDGGSEKLDIPPPPPEVPKMSDFNFHDQSCTPAEKATMKKEMMNQRKKSSEMHSLRMDALYKLSIANHMRDQIFWFPHSMDFRGRTYPCPPYFNHLGSDVTRAVLLFAEGKPLGPRGLNWLKIHLINLTGLKKRSSLQGRMDYADAIMEDILDSADKPLNGRKWWMNADEPWQALACCMEIANAVRSPDAAKFVSHFPVHQDGSCNGLQHYAALGRDVIGAKSVNLMPCDEPQDVYSGVAQQVEALRARDAASGLKIAKVLDGYISRKVVKQTVMTVVYGVTRFGGRLQIEKRLKEIDEFPKDHVWEASHYLVRQVFSGIKEMFTGTREIQDWLTESARLISKSGHTVEWVTPLGLPVVQPYHRSRFQAVKSDLQVLNLQITHDSKQRPDMVKQKNAFPPNFIHSLDSTHMMLTALHCYSAGLTFVSVHDCFWTHALTVDRMNKVCRDQFVALHNQPILQQLSEFLLFKYCSSMLADEKSKKYQEYRRLFVLLSKVPLTGDFDLQQVKESTYFFS